MVGKYPYTNLKFCFSIHLSNFTTQWNTSSFK